MIRLAGEYGIRSILQIAFYRPSTSLDHSIEVNGDRRPIAPEVWGHFRNIHRIRYLEESTGLEIKVFDKEFTSPRGGYVEEVIRLICDCQRKPKLVFLDPDTGIAPPSGAGLEHVKPSELAEVFSALGTGDVLVFYQHARRVKDWLTETRREFVTALDAGDTSVTTITCPEIAKDVAFFVAEKGESSDVRGDA